MKKSVIILSLILLCNLALAAPTFTVQSTQLQPGETFLANLTGNFTQKLKTENFQFYEGRRTTFFDREIIKHNGNYYFYAYITREGNFTLKIAPILYQENGLKEFSQEIPFEVKKNFMNKTIEIKESGNITYENQTYTQILSIKPGFLNENQNEITLKNEGSEELNLTIQENLITIPALSSQNVQVTKYLNFSYITLSTYKNFQIPVTGAEKTPEEENYTIGLSEKLIHLTINANETHKQNLTLFNLGDKNITELEIKSTIENLNYNSINELNARTEKKILLEFPKYENEGYTKGNITLTYEVEEKSYTQIVPVEIYIFPENISKEDFNINQNTCSSVGGDLCQGPETCDGEATFTIDGYCCIGTCVAPENANEEGGSGWILGVLIFLVLAIMGTVIFLKIRKTKKPKAEDKLKQSTQHYQKRVSGSLGRG